MEIVKYRGLPVVVSNNYRLENYAAAMDYKPKDDDIIVATFPKTGTTWVQYIVWQIHQGESYQSMDDANYRLMPYMELTGMDAVEKLKPPRVYKTHLPYTHLNINPNAKYLYVHRNPGDTFVSYVHFWNEIRDTRIFNSIPMDDFFELLMSGEFSYGDYFDHVLSFYAHRNDANVLFLSYENLKSDTRTGVLRIAKFLGEEYHQRLIEDDSLLQKILEVTSFEYMKKHLKFQKKSLGIATKGDKNSSSSKEILEEEKEEGQLVDFFRKGVVGEGCSQLSKEQRKQLLEKVVKKMENTELLEPWKNSLAI